MLFVTLREDPAEAEIPSHKLLLRAGYIRRIGSGVYAYLPLMWRVLKKISQITREEMDATGAMECLLPQLQPSELWKESGRWDTYTKAEGIMFSLVDRQKREWGLGPTHEEIITTIAKELIRSYRQLPLHLYQIQTKFRDEIRPRFGLMRGREFIMKDGYSFHSSQESLKETYQVIDRAYRNILTRCGLSFRAVEADSGAIGGSGSQEFMVLAEAGEDEILYTEDQRYAANVEKAVSLPPDAVTSSLTERATVETPNIETIEKLAEFFQTSPTVIIKTVLYEAIYDSGVGVLVLISIRGDQSVNEVKLQNELVKQSSRYQAKTVIALKVPDASTLEQYTIKPLPLGYIGPDISDEYLAGKKAFLRFVDKNAVSLSNFITGANEKGYHRVGVNWETDIKRPDLIVDIRKAVAGDRSIHDASQILQTARGIEVGHIFQLGTKYSQAMNATYTSEGGEDLPLVMGCYGLGVSRLAQAAVEQSYDKNGIIWPLAIAPYEVIIVVPNIKDSEQMKVAESLYNELNKARIETLLDDRDERAGVKFKDAELIGIPYRLVTGKSLQEGLIEVVERKTGKVDKIPVKDVVDFLELCKRKDLGLSFDEQSYTQFKLGV